MKKFLALVLSLCMVFSLAAVASAAEIDADGGSGSTPVYLSSTADGSIGGDPAPTAMSVTIPTGLPMAMSQSGDDRQPFLRRGSCPQREHFRRGRLEADRLWR